MKPSRTNGLTQKSELSEKVPRIAGAAWDQISIARQMSATLEEPTSPNRLLAGNLAFSASQADLP
jgi:hypothetical protein